MSAELHGLSMAVNLVKSSEIGIYTIFTDSKSALTAILNFKRNGHPLITKMTHEIDTLRRSGRLISFVWIPGHVGIVGNEKADRAAASASKRCVEFIPVHYQDCYKALYARFFKKKALEWSRSRTKLHDVYQELKDKPKEFISCRTSEVIVNRLRLGHCLFSHSYLMESGAPPPCCFCQQELMSVKHVLTVCPSLNWARNLYLTYAHSNSSAPATLSRVLGGNCDVLQLIDFLSNIGLLHRV